MFKTKLTLNEFIRFESANVMPKNQISLFYSYFFNFYLIFTLGLSFLSSLADPKSELILYSQFGT